MTIRTQLKNIYSLATNKRLWHLGNTTVRSPFRLREGLLVLRESGLEGELYGIENEIRFRQALGDKKIVHLGDDKTNSVGRKWRGALSQLGFIYDKRLSRGDSSLVGRITPNGERLIRASSVPAMQECFLRSMAGYRIPSILETKYKFKSFSPLNFTLRVMNGLGKTFGSSAISMHEMALFLQATSAEQPIKEVVESIIHFREERGVAVNKRKFDRESLLALASDYAYKEQTFNDYADVNFRYLRSTGLFNAKGRSLTLNDDKMLLITKLIEREDAYPGDELYLEFLTQGSTLPTDNLEDAKLVFNDLLSRSNNLGIKADFSGYDLSTVANIDSARIDLESKLLDRREVDYAKRQAGEWLEILDYLRVIGGEKRDTTKDDIQQVTVPKSEAPAYFEWAVWRAFLAINKILLPPYETRRFKVDQDSYPVGNAPGNGPDLAFEFETYHLVVEVTLTQGSRQEAAEGESVRRHTAKYALMSKGDKPVYGLFIAKKVDINSLDQFQRKVYYVEDDQPVDVNIVPLTLEQFSTLFERLFLSQKIDNVILQHLLDACLSCREDCPSPNLWRDEVGKIFNSVMHKLKPV